MTWLLMTKDQKRQGFLAPRPIPKRTKAKTRLFMPKKRLKKPKTRLWKTKTCEQDMTFKGQGFLTSKLNKTNSKTRLLLTTLWKAKIWLLMIKKRLSKEKKQGFLLPRLRLSQWLLMAKKMIKKDKTNDFEIKTWHLKAKKIQGFLRLRPRPKKAKTRILMDKKRHKKTKTLNDQDMSHDF